MPTSDMRIIPFVVNEAFKLNPKSVLDVGCGFGKYGFLLREYLEITKERYLPRSWKVVIDALEIYKPYIQDWHGIFYDHVYTGDIRKFALKDYDLILLCDVLEHLLWWDAKKALDRCLERSKWVILTMPNGFMHQNPVNGNRKEEHLSGFKPSDFSGEVVYEDRDVFCMLMRGKLNG